MSDDEKIAEIKERHFHDEHWRNGPSMGFETICPQTHDDRATLLAEVERLRAALRRIGMPLNKVAFCRDGHEIAVLLARETLEGEP